MDRAVLNSGQPVRNLQTFLRRISYHYNTVSTVVPDGIFSDQTCQSVKSFQKTFNLPQTGIVNKGTWNKIVEVYSNIIEVYAPPVQLSLIKNAEVRICSKEENNMLYAIQSLLFVISERFTNIPPVDICAVHNEASVKAVKKIQEICNLPQDGVIDKLTYNMIAIIYKTFILAPDNKTKNANKTKNDSKTEKD